MFYDITLPINNKMIVWPGDRSVSIDPIFEIDRDGYSVSRISLDSHTGTHLDSPRHFIRGGDTIDDFPPDLMINRAKVFETGTDEINRSYLSDIPFSSGDIVLFKTRNRHLLDKDEFDDSYVALSKDGAEYLVEKCIRLVGIDYMSIEKRGAKGYPVHKTLLGNGIFILEGIYLNDVPSGHYRFYCFPMRIEQGNGAPARVLLEG